MEPSTEPKRDASFIPGSIAPSGCSECRFACTSLSFCSSSFWLSAGIGEGQSGLHECRLHRRPFRLGGPARAGACAGGAALPGPHAGDRHVPHRRRHPAAISLPSRARSSGSPLAGPLVNVAIAAGLVRRAGLARRPGCRSRVLSDRRTRTCLSASPRATWCWRRSICFRRSPWMADGFCARCWPCGGRRSRLPVWPPARASFWRSAWGSTDCWRPITCWSSSPSSCTWAPPRRARRRWGAF